MDNKVFFGNLLGFRDVSGKYTGYALAGMQNLEREYFPG
jgi:hypothetical protein